MIIFVPLLIISLVQLTAAKKIFGPPPASFAAQVTDNIVDPGVAYHPAGNATIYGPSQVLAVYDHYVDINKTFFTLNYELYNKILALDIQKRDRHTRNGDIAVAIKNTYKKDPSAKEVIHPVVLNTDWLSLISFIAGNFTSGIGTKTSTGNQVPCSNTCYDRETGGYTYHLCSYVYAANKKSCGFSNTLREHIIAALKDAFETDAQPDCTGRRFMLYNHGSTEAWLTIVRKDDMTMAGGASDFASHDEL